MPSHTRKRYATYWIESGIAFMFTEATVETSVKGPVYKSEVLKVQFEIVKIGLQKVKVVLIASVYYRWKKCSFDTAVAYNAGLVRAVACIMDLNQF